eukprot:2047666-Rhodomonas_salina.1
MAYADTYAARSKCIGLGNSFLYLTRVVNKARIVKITLKLPGYGTRLLPSPYPSLVCDHSKTQRERSLRTQSLHRNSLLSEMDSTIAQSPTNAQRKSAFVHQQAAMLQNSQRSERSTSITDSLFQSAQGLMNRLSFGANGNDSIQQDVPFLVEFSNSPRSGAHTQAELQNVACRRASDPTEAERLQMISRGPVLPIKNTQDVKCDSPDSTPITTPDPSAIGNNTSTLGSSSPVNLAGAGAENVMAHTAWLDAKTLRVEPGANLPKIVKAVPKGTTIVLAPGEYKQTASIRVSTDQISLIAECDIEGRPLGAVIITGDAADIPKGPLLNVSSPSGSIRDLTLHLTGVEKVPRDESAKLRPVMVSCVAVTKQSNASFVGLDITSPNARGFEIRSRATPSVSRCTIRDTIMYTLSSSPSLSFVC